MDAANFTVLRVKRDILRRSSVGAHADPPLELVGGLGSNDGYGVDATFSVYQNLRMDTYVARTRTDGKDGGDGSYLGLFDYNADKYGVQAERLQVAPNFNPEIGFVRRRICGATLGSCATARGRRRAACPQADVSGHINYTTNTTTSARHARGGRPVPV